MKYKKIVKGITAFALCLLFFIVVLIPAYGNQTRLSFLEDEIFAEWIEEAAIYWNPEGDEEVLGLATRSNSKFVAGLTPDTAVKTLEDAIKTVEWLSRQLEIEISDTIIYAMSPMRITDGMTYIVKGNDVSIAPWHGREFDENYIFMVEGGKLLLHNLTLQSGDEATPAEKSALLYLSSGVLQLGAQVEVDGTFVLDYHQTNDNREFEHETDEYQKPRIELTKKFDFASDSYQLDLRIPETYEEDVIVVETLTSNKQSATEYTDAFAVINHLDEWELVAEEQIDSVWSALITEQTYRQTRKRLVARSIANSDNLFPAKLPQNGYAADDFVNQPLGGNILSDGDETKLVVMEADGDPDAGYYKAYPASIVGLREALFDLYQENQPSADYIMYFGSDIINIPAALFNNTTTATSTSNVTFASLRGRVHTLVLTGHQDDLVTNEPAMSTPTETSLISIASSGERYFGCNLILRNIRYTFGASSSTTQGVYMNGYSITLGGNSWHTASTRFFGGASTGVVAPAEGTAAITVYSTGSGVSYFIGGMRTGTMNGNASITICNTSGNSISIYGGGLGTGIGSSIDVPANITGSVTNTITGMATTSGGLSSFVGGVAFGAVSGPITNTISGEGRFASNSMLFTGGNRYGDVGSDATLGGAVDTSDLSTLADTDDYIIKNIVDFSTFTAGAVSYTGTNYATGIVKGNIVNIVTAGAYNQGSLAVFYGGASNYSAINVTTWPDLFTINSSTGEITNVDRALAVAKTAARYQLYGNITNVIKKGSISSATNITEAGTYAFRGAGYGGYMEGNVYSELGTEGLVYGRNSNDYNYSTIETNQGYNSWLTLVGGGGASTSIRYPFCLKGDITLVTKNVLASGTYAGNIGTVQIGDSLRIHHGGVVDSCMGAGYRAYLQVGDSRAEVHGGQVDWLLSANGYQNDYQDGDISVKVFDKPNIIINGSIAGSYGRRDAISGDGYSSISGDSTMVIHGGDFSGSPRISNGQGFTAGQLGMGQIYGDISITFDLRGNQYGFSLAEGDIVSVSRGSGSASYIGTNADNTITLNIFTDDAQTDLLNGLNIYGDYANSASVSNNTNAGHIIINVNAPGARLGNLYATNYANLNSGTLRRNVEINLVSVAEITGLFAGNGTENITNTVAAASVQAGKYAVINVGPQSENRADILGDWESGQTVDGLPHRIHVSTNGIIGFTSMNIRKRLLIAEQGNIKHSFNATVANHGTSYHQFGDLTLHAGEGMAGAGLGVTADNAAFIAGTTYIEGDGLVYIQSTGKADQIVLTDIITNGDSALDWMKVGNVTPDTNLQSNWFGSNIGWRVITLSPDKMKAEERITPVNFRGFAVADGETYMGDSDTHFAGNYGYAVAIPGSVYTWEVTEGDGMISHNVPVSTEPPSPGQAIYAYGTVAKDTPSQKGSLAIPTAWVPDPIPYPEFSFIPDAVQAEWVEGVDIYGSDRYRSEHPHNYFVDTGAMYEKKSWTASGDDKEYSFDIKARFARGDAQVTAQDVILTETQAAAISSAEDVIAYHQASGEPLFRSSITAELLEQIRTPLGANQIWRSHSVSYFAGEEGLTETQAQVTVQVTVVRDEAEISSNQQYAVYADSAVLTLEQAQAVSGQADLDSGYTNAVVILADGTMAEPVINDEALAEIIGATAETTPKNVSVSYQYAPDSQSEVVTKNIVIHIEGPEEVDVTISKMVAGDYGDRTRGFLFEIYFWDNQNNRLPEGTEFIYLGSTISESGVEAPENGVLRLDQEGKAEVVLKHGQQITIVGAPQGSIRMIEAFHSQYEVTFSSSLAGVSGGADTGMVSLIGAGTDAAFDFINTRREVVPTGIRMGTVPVQRGLLLLLLVLVPLTSGTLLYYYRRRSLEHG